jgi:hypothetical protein
VQVPARLISFWRKQRPAQQCSLRPGGLRQGINGWSPYFVTRFGELRHRCVEKCELAHGRSGNKMSAPWNAGCTSLRTDRRTQSAAHPIYPHL